MKEQHVRSKYPATAAALAGIFSESFFYGIDSYKVLKQGGEKPRLRSLFKGIGPVLLCGTAPTFFVFFATYEPLKREFERKDSPVKLPNSVGVPLASFVGGVVACVVGTPADVAKKRLMLGGKSVEGKGISSIVSTIVRTEGYSGLFRGLHVNLVKDLPFAVIKLSSFEACTRMYKTHVLQNQRDVNGKETAFLGFSSGVFTSICTTTLDNVNTRVKSTEFPAEISIFEGHKRIVQKDGFLALSRGFLPRTINIAFGSMVFWYFFAKANAGLETLADSVSSPHPNTSATFD